LCFATTVSLSEQVYIAGQLFCRVFHLILQPLGLCFAQPLGVPAPYRLKVSGWIVGSNNSKGMGSSGNNDVAVEALKAFPRRLASFDDNIRARWPAVGTRSSFRFDAVEHRSDSDHYAIKIVPLGTGVLLQHIELCLDPPTVVCMHFEVPSGKTITSAENPTRGYSSFSSSVSLFARPVSFAFSSRSCSTAWRSRPSSASCSTKYIIHHQK